MASIDSVADKNVSELFDEALQIYDDVLGSNESNNNPRIQAQLIEAISLLEEATKVVSLVGMFSSNESVEEISTADVKFLLLPALLGALTLRLCLPYRRSHVVDTAELYFRDFLKRCQEYGVIDFGPPAQVAAAAAAATLGGPQDIAQLVSKRNAKIARYKDRKQLEARLAELRVASAQSADEDAKRDFYLTLTQSLASQALEELENITSERPLIVHMEGLPRGGGGAGREGREAPPPLRPIIITRDEIQKKIYGAGYPSLPTMTVGEFYQQRVSRGEFPDPDAPHTPALPAWALEESARVQAARQEEGDETRAERDDPELLAQKRGMDEFKDDHRRGWGNRMNRS